MEAITESKGKPGGQKKPRVEGGLAIQTDESGSGNEANEKKSTKQSKAAKAVEGEKKNPVVQLGRCYQWRPHIRKPSGPLFTKLSSYVLFYTERCSPLLFSTFSLVVGIFGHWPCLL